jgi:NAD+ synthase (glutamine-hydrolysing)
MRIRTRIAQMQVQPGQPDVNAARMLEHIRQARRDGVRLLVFPEMALPGYLIGDEWEREAFLRECEACARELVQAAEQVITVFGTVAVDWQKRNEDGRVRKYNALMVAQRGRRVGPQGTPLDYVVKTLHPNYRQFDDSRHFFGLRKLAAELGLPPSALIRPVSVDGLRLGCVICEDAWSADYGLSPLAELARHGMDVCVCASASPYTFDKRDKRARVFADHARRQGVPLLFANHVGMQNNGKTVFVYDGSSCAYDAQGRSSPLPPAFEEAAPTFDLALGAAAQDWPRAAPPRPDDTSDLYRAVDYGTRRFLELAHTDKVVIGVSGGIDSAVAAALYRCILPAENLLLVSMPGPYTSATTRQLAGALARNLGCRFAEVPIGAAVDLCVAQLDGLPLALPHDSDAPLRLAISSSVLENIQARDRSARVLAAVAAAFGGVFTCNANKCEMTAGYSTLYGDAAGFFANLADLWKGEVYGLARYLNETVYGRDVIPAACLTLPPSAELNAAQNVDAGQGDPLHYPYHDRLFASWTESWNRTTPEEILRWYGQGELESQLGYPGRIANLFADNAAFVADLERWWERYQGMGLVKRVQAPPVLALKRRAFGFDHRESILGPRYTRQYRHWKERLLRPDTPLPPSTAPAPPTGETP